jgi:hypothetical protein
LARAGATYAPVVALATGTAPNDVVAMDVKGDGVLDAVTSAGGAGVLAIHFGNGAGSLSGPLFRTTGSAPSALAVGRLDSDAYDDIVVGTNSGAYVHRGLVTGIQANGTPQYVLQDTSRIALADLDGDLVLDALGLDGGPHQARVLGDGAGGFQRSTTFGASGGSTQSSVDLEFADFDGDGDLDSIEAYGNATNLRANLGGGVFATAMSSTTFAFPGNQSESTKAPDLNNDGNADLVARSYEHVGTRLGFGNGSFGAQTTYSYAGFVQGLTAGDLDLDGDVDVAVGEMEDVPGQITIRWNNGAGVLLNPTSFLTGTSSDPWQPSITVLDFDGDGKLDIAAVDAGLSKRAKLFRGTGLGTFVSVQTTNFNVRGEFIAAGDIDGDGLDDIACGGGGNASHDNSGWALRSNGTQFGSSMVLDYKAGVGAFAATKVMDVALEDVDGDGFGDALFSATCHEAFSNSGHYEIVLFPGRSDGTFGAPRSFASASSAHAIAAVDLDGDSRAEIGVLGSGGPMPILPLSILQHECDGAAGTFGVGCVGSGGFTPRLGFQGCPTPGGNVALRVDRGLGGATALVFVGMAPASLAVSANCDLLTVPVLPTPIALPLLGTGAGVGNLTAPLTLPSTFGGVSFVLQAFLVDPGVTLGASATQGVIVNVF